MKKILIIGNSGSGKTWLGNRLSAVLEIPHFGLDNIFWEPGGHNHKKGEADVTAELREIQKAPSWIVEGVFGHLADQLSAFADTIVYLDLPWDECRNNLLKRGAESSSTPDPINAENNLHLLLDWASAYDTRDSKASKKYHCLLFESFRGVQHRIKSRDAIDQFIANASADPARNLGTLSAHSEPYAGNSSF